jgi:fatty acid desaturase
MTPAEERQIAMKYMGLLAWPTMLLFTALVTAYTYVIVAVVNGSLPLLAGTAINSWVAFWFYTIHHEANHGNISGQRKSLRWIDLAMGTVASIPLHINYSAYVPQHLQHHAHTNVPGKDPDFYLSGPGKGLVSRWLLITTIKNVGSVPGLAQLALKVLPKPLAMGMTAFMKNRPGIMLYNRACLAVLFASFFLGQGTHFFFLWWLPAQFSQLFLQMWFSWLPHYDFSQTSRYLNTRVRGFFLSHILLLGTDHHLIHHLYPRVPFYKLRPLFRDIRPSLDANNAVIIGVPGA